MRGVAGRRAPCPSVIETFGCEASVPAQPLGASAPPDRGRWLSACRRRSQPLSPTASPQSILRYELGACPPSGEPVTPHFPASPHMPPNTASRGASAPAGTRLTCSPTAAGSCRALTRAELRRRQRERSRPLWETWFLPGLPGGRVGLYLKVHHVIADGPAAVAMLGALLDTVPEAAPSSGRPWTPAPSTRDLCEAHRLRTSARVLAASSRPVTTARRAPTGWRAVREALARAWRRGPASTGRSARIAGSRWSAAASRWMLRGARAPDPLRSGCCGPAGRAQGAPVRAGTEVRWGQVEGTGHRVAFATVRAGARDRTLQAGTSARPRRTP